MSGCCSPKRSGPAFESAATRLVEALRSEEVATSLIAVDPGSADDLGVIHIWVGGNRDGPAGQRAGFCWGLLTSVPSIWHQVNTIWSWGPLIKAKTESFQLSSSERSMTEISPFLLPDEVDRISRMCDLTRSRLEKRGRFPNASASAIVKLHGGGPILSGGWPIPKVGNYPQGIPNGLSKGRKWCCDGRHAPP